jgi:hypothetical protein
MAAKDVYNITNDGTIDQFNPSFTARDYVSRVRNYLNSNLIKKHLKALHLLYFDNFFINQMLISCNFQNDNCSIDDFMPHYDFQYGLCWRFNSGRSLQGKILPIRTSGLVGLRNGLQLELYTGNARIQEKFTITRGFRVLVFNKSTVYPVAADIGVNVATGQTTYIGLTRTFAKHLPAPFSNCLPTDTTKIDWSQNEILQFMYDNFVKGQYYSNEAFWSYAGNWTWDWKVTYSQSNCVKLCFQKYLFQECG